MVKLRLKRMGKRHYPIYKIVAADSRFPRDGRFIEAVGTYNPNLDPMEVKLKEERVKYWLKVGAQPTDTVRNLLQSEGLILKLRLEKKGVAADVVESEFQKFLSDKDSKIQRAKEKKTRRKLNKKSKTAVKETGDKTTAAANTEEVKKAPEAPVTETPVKEAPVAETTVKEVAVAETPVKEAPVAETPVKEVPVAETPVKETPVTETPTAESTTASEPEAEQKA